MRKLLLIILIFTGISAKADTTLVAYGSAWKYLDDGSDQGTAWSDSSFADSSWQAGNAQLGYGDGDETTIISYGGNASNKYITYYFRQKFVISNLYLYSAFTINLKRDDGAVIYINGQEVFRSNMPAGAITYTTTSAGEAMDDGNTPQTQSVASSFFSEGENTIAVEVHQLTQFSSDITFDLELTGHLNAPPVIVRNPYLQNVTPSGITVKWRTDLPCTSKLFYGTVAGIFTDSIEETLPVTDHEIVVSNLAAGSKYFYAVSGNDYILQGDSANYFYTAPIAGSVQPVSIWMVGDVGMNNADQNLVRDAFLNFMGSAKTDLALMLGDNAYLNGTDAEYQSAFFQNHYENILKNLPLYSCMGNHETPSSDPVTQTGPYFDIFSFPKNGEAGGVPSASEAYYSFDYANIHFVCLESNLAINRDTAGAQVQWLINDLNSTTQKWIVVFFHHPPYSKGGHNSDSETELYEMRQNILPILEQHRVDLVLSGHSHSYERSYFLNGHYGNSSSLTPAMILSTSGGTKPQPYIKNASANYTGTVYVQAGNGSVIEPTQAGWPHPANYLSDLSLGSLVMDVYGDTLTVRMIDADTLSPHVIDNFSILKQCDITAAMQNLPQEICITAAPITLSGAVPAGGIYSGNGVSNNIFNPAVAGAGIDTIVYTYTDVLGCSAVAKSAIKVVGSVPAQPSSITGQAVVCPPTYSMPYSISSVADADSYTWTASNGIVFNGSVADTSVQASFNIAAGGTYTLQVIAGNVCGAGAVQTKVISKSSAPAVTVYGPQVVCAGQTKTYFVNATSGLATYTWNGPAGTLINAAPVPATVSGLSVNALFAPDFTSGLICASSKPECVSSTKNKCVAVNSKPSQPDFSSKPKGVCPGQTGVVFSITPVNGATGYSWTLPANAVLVSGQNSTTITIDFDSSYTTGILSVSALSACDSSIARSVLVKSISGAAVILPASVTGPTAGLCGLSGISYSAPVYTGLWYVWSVPAALSITSGQGTNQITVNVDSVFSTGSVCVKTTSGCNSSSWRCITVKGRPGTVPVSTNPPVICANTTGNIFTVGSVPGATSFLWSINPPASATIVSGQNTDTAVIDWNSSNANVNCIVGNSCGNFTAVKNITLSCRQAGENSFGNLADQCYIYPNPVKGKLHVFVNTSVAEIVTLKLFDISGKRVREIKHECFKGFNDIEVVLSENPGIYFFEIYGSTIKEVHRISVY